MANPSPIIHLHQARSGRGAAATALAEEAPASRPAPAGPPAENRQLGFLIDRFLAHHRRKNRSRDTIKWHRDSLADFEAFFVRNQWPTDIDQDPKVILAHARAWLDDLYQRKNAFGRRYSDESLATRVRSVRAFFSWVSEEDYTPFHYLAKLEKPVVGRKHPKALSDSQLEQLLQTRALQPTHYLGVRNLALVLVYLDTWCRLREVVELEMKDVHLDDGWIKVLGKGNREAVVHLSPATVDVLTRYIDQWRPRPKAGHMQLFLQENGMNLTARAVQVMMTRIRYSTGLPISPHRLRHTGATAGARKGMTMDRIQAKLRHSSPRATLGYVGLAAEINEHQSGLECLNIEIKLPRKSRPPAR